MYFIAFGITCSGKTRKNPGRNKDSGNLDLERNRGRRTEYTPLHFIDFLYDKYKVIPFS